MMRSTAEFAITPPITLDTTLTDLYNQTSPNGRPVRVAQVLCGISSIIALGPEIPPNRKYVYQDDLFNSGMGKTFIDPQQSEEVKRSQAARYFSLVTQRDAFICGSTSVVVFDKDASSTSSHHAGSIIGHVNKEQLEQMEMTLSSLRSDQRPKLVFCAGGPRGVARVLGDSDLVAYKLALDNLEDLSLTVQLRDSWYVNSKAALACSELPTPASKVISMLEFGCPPLVEECCEWCQREGLDAVPIMPQCSGARGHWVTRATKTVLDEVGKASVPFVLKNQQSYGGAGTYLVNTEEEKEEIVREGGKFEEVMRRVLSKVDGSNWEMDPAGVVVCEMVDDVVGDYGMTFFVAGAGEDVFLAVSEQMTDEGGSWTGSIIDYEAQERCKTRFKSIMDQIATWLRQHGYWGPVGADILEGKGGSLKIVDINARTSGSMCLPLLRGHLWERRGMRYASSLTVTVDDGSNRDEFLDRWRHQSEAGTLLVISWCQDGGSAVADVVVSGRGRRELQQRIDEIQQATRRVTF